MILICKKDMLNDNKLEKKETKKYIDDLKELNSEFCNQDSIIVEMM